jgi:hypothetical protein
MPAPVWDPVYIPKLTMREPLGRTPSGEAVTFSPAFFRWLTENVYSRLGETSGPGLAAIVAVLTQAVQDIDALEAADVAFDTRVDAVEAELEELNMKPAIRMDADADPPTLIYRGEAVAGTTESAASWRIKKIEFLAGNDIKVTWADGNTNFDNVWNDRASLTYT